jgi:hypothetical protein
VRVGFPPRRPTLLAAAVTCAVLAVPAIASAKDFCVGVPSDCTGAAVPAAGLAATLAEAVINGSDDRVFLGTATFDAGALSYNSLDKLELIGAGAGKSVLRSSAGGPVLTLGGNPESKLSGLTAQVMAGANAGPRAQRPERRRRHRRRGARRHDQHRRAARRRRALQPWQARDEPGRPCGGERRHRHGSRLLDQGTARHGDHRGGVGADGPPQHPRRASRRPRRQGSRLRIRGLMHPRTRRRAGDVALRRRRGPLGHCDRGGRRDCGADCVGSSRCVPRSSADRIGLVEGAAQYPADLPPTSSPSPLRGPPAAPWRLSAWAARAAAPAAGRRRCSPHVPRVVPNHCGRGGKSLLMTKPSAGLEPATPSLPWRPASRRRPLR